MKYQLLFAVVTFSLLSRHKVRLAFLVRGLKILPQPQT